MKVLNHIINALQNLAGDLSDSVLLSLLLGSFFAILTTMLLRLLIGALFAMHKSKTKVKRIKANYSVWQKVVLKPAWDTCEHAIKFCRTMIVVHHARVLLFLACLLCLILSNWIPILLALSAWCITIVGFALDVPAMILQVALDRYPFRRNRHEYRFEKYHNTPNHDSIF